MPETMPPGHVASNKDDLIVCYYYLCIGQIKRDSFAEAKAVVKKLLAIDPQNIQGRQLQTYMEDEEHNRGVKGLVGKGWPMQPVAPQQLPPATHPAVTGSSSWLRG